jgi:hypothetical protein
MGFENDPNDFPELKLSVVMRFAAKWVKHYSFGSFSRIVLYRYEYPPIAMYAFNKVNDFNPDKHPPRFAILFEIPDLDLGPHLKETPGGWLEDTKKGLPYRDFIEKTDILYNHRRHLKPFIRFFDGFEAVYSTPPTRNLYDDWIFIPINPEVSDDFEQLNLLLRYVERDGPFWVLYDRYHDSKSLRVKKKPESNEHREKCREIAEKLWRKHPYMTIEDMCLRDEITLVFKDRKKGMYAPKTIRGWIKDLCPNRSPGRRKAR